MLRFAVFPFLSIWFLVFGQNTSGFSDLVSVVVFGFSSAIMYLNRVRENKFDESSDEDVDTSTDDNSSQGQLTCDQASFYSGERASVTAT